MPSRRLVHATAMWACALLGSVALAIPVDAVQELVATLLFAAFALLLWWDGSSRLPALAAALGATGLVLSAIPVPAVRAFADGAVSCTVVVVVIFLVRSALEDAPPRRPAGLVRQADLALRLRLSAVREETWRRVPLVTAGALFVLALLAGVLTAGNADGWKIVGSAAGAPVWNASLFATPLHRRGAVLIDDEIITPRGVNARVGIGDSPALDALKLAAPGAWQGPQIVNALNVLDLAALLIAACWLVALLVGSWSAAAPAVLVALLVTPLLQQTAMCAPLDLWPALAASALAVRGDDAKAIAAAALAGLLNVAGGYEAAVLALALASTGWLRVSVALPLGIAGVASSIVGALLSRALAPDATTLAVWWSTNDIGRLVRATDTAWPWALAALAGAALVAGWVIALRARANDLGRHAVLAAVVLVLALPPLFGGVPLIVPSRLLNLLPVGWPSARILDLLVVVAVLPLAAVLRRAVEHDRVFRDPLKAAGLVALALGGFVLARPVPPHVLLPPLAPGASVVELPIAEPGSRAAFLFADDLLERRARIAQPIPYVAGDTALGVTSSTDDVIDAVRGFPLPAYVVVRRDVYADPRQRFSEPTVIDASEYAVPPLTRDPRVVLSTLTEQAEVYRVRR